MDVADGIPALMLLYVLCVQLILLMRACCCRAELSKGGAVSSKGSHNDTFKSRSHIDTACEARSYLSVFQSVDSSLFSQGPPRLNLPPPAAVQNCNA